MDICISKFQRLRDLETMRTQSNDDIDSLGLDFYSLSLGFLGKLLILELKQEIQRKFLGRTQDEPNITEGSVNGVCVLLVLIFWSRDLCDC